jgi:hypothetical protein
MKINWNHVFFYPKSHELAGSIRGWIMAVVVACLIIATGYVEGLEQAL